MEDRDVRAVDYLNDKLQTTADLENLDFLLDNVKNQQAVLKKQLREAELTLKNASEASRFHSASVLQQAKNFSKQQADVDRRLLIVTQSETSDDAIRKFASSMEKLRRLDVATGYIELLAEVDKLSSEARRNFQVSPQAALQPYVRLQNLVTFLTEAQPAAEGAAPHLVDHVETAAATLWEQMKSAFSGEFEGTLTKMKWPSKDVNLAGRLKEEWTAGVEKLLDLQEPELNARDTDREDHAGARDPLVLLPLEVMANPLELRFTYHFEGQRPTNKLNRPEYFLSHILGLLDTHNEFFVVYLQPILRKHFQGTNLASNPLYIDSTSALITSFLPMLRRKISTFLPQIEKQPQLISHFLHELMNFDHMLKEDWGYDGGCGAEGWNGLTWEILVKKEWFSKWLQVEKDFALSRYQTIINTTESGEIDYDGVDSGTTKPTKAAIRVNDLLETVTDRYRLLTSFSQKLRFLIDIQIAIFDRFHSRLSSSLEAYLSLTSSIGRTVQGVSKEDQAQLQGLGGLERLCRVYGSAEYLEKKMRDWSDDVFFVELWDELQDRARRNTGNNIAGPMSMVDVAERTSSAVGSQEDSGALFDETAGAYRRLHIRTETIMRDMLIYNIQESLRPYGRINPWSSLSPDATNASSLALTAELDNTMQQLSTYLSFLFPILAKAPFRRIVSQLAAAISNFLWDHILMRNSFSTAGIAQFTRDVQAIWEVVDRYLGEGQGGRYMKKMAEALVLLGLPFEGEMGLWEVERRVFRSNESGREVLGELGLEELSEGEARGLLGRRVELGGG